MTHNSTSLKRRPPALSAAMGGVFSVRPARPAIPPAQAPIVLITMRHLRG